MKRLFFCLVAMMSVFSLAAQSEFENEVINNIMARRSVRKYLDKPVEHAKLEAVAQAGINAPSARNWQYWAVRIIEDQKLINDVSEVYKQANPDAVSRDPNFKNMFRNAPNLICVCAPQDGGFCFSQDGTQFLNVAMYENPRSYEIKAYSVDVLSEIGTVFSSDEFGVFDIECGDDGEYYVLGNGNEAFVGIIKDGKLVEKYSLTFEQSTLYSDALRLRRTGYTMECYKSTFAATGIFPGSLSLDGFVNADLTLKKLFDEHKTGKQFE